MTPDELGRALVAARRRGVAWKVLMRRHGLGRTRLYVLWRAARDRPPPPADANDKRCSVNISALDGGACTELGVATFDTAAAEASMGFLMPKPSVPAVPPAPQMPTREDPAVLEARRKALVAERQRRGVASTIVTGGGGLSGAADVRRPTLLSGTA